MSITYLRKKLEGHRSLNIVHLLNDREHNIDRRFTYHPRRSKEFCLDFFKCIPPNLSVCDVVKQQNYIRKFSPDGKYLICFSQDQQWLECYNFLGTARAYSLLQECKEEFVGPSDETAASEYIRENIFNKIFDLRWGAQLTMSIIRPLYREFNIFTDDGKYIIVATHSPIHETQYPSYLTLNSINRFQTDYNLFHYRFYLIRLDDGETHDTMEFDFDFIKLSHNQAVSVKGNLMALISSYHQRIHVILLENGKFTKLRAIGIYPHGSEECFCHHVPEYKEFCMAPDNGENGFKQRILIHLYRKILAFDRKKKRTEMLKLFYKRMYVFEAMELVKLQFLDKDHLLIRYDMHECPEVTTNENHMLFVVYNLVDDEIRRVSSENSMDLLWYYVFYCDTFRDTRSPFTGLPSSSTSNCYHLRRYQARSIEFYPRGSTEPAQRMLPQIPLAKQSYSTSPFMDLNLFHYESHSISALERPRFSNYEPIRFRDRLSGIVLFRLFFGHTGTRRGVPASRRPTFLKQLIWFAYHPFEPFFISVQKTENKYVTNFHIRNPATIVKS